MQQLTYYCEDAKKSHNFAPSERLSETAIPSKKTHLEVEFLWISILESHLHILDASVVRSGQVESCRSIGHDDCKVFVVRNVVIVDWIQLEGFGVRIIGLSDSVFFVELVALFLELQGLLQVGFVWTARLHLQLGVVVPPEFELLKAEIGLKL